MPKNNALEKHFTASAIIIEKDKILLVHHKKLGVWLYPGGHIEKNETPEQAVIREVKEETGLDIEIICKKDNSLSDPDNDIAALCIPYEFLCELVGDHYHNDIIYLARISGSRTKISFDSNESNDIKFFGLNDLDNIKLFPNFKRLLIKVLKKS